MFGRKKKQVEAPTSNADNYQMRLEILGKNIDLRKLSAEIEKFLTKSSDPFDFNTYTIHDFPEKQLKVFNIDYGLRKPTTKFLVVIEGDSNHLRILDRLPTNYAAYAQALLISPIIFFPTVINAQVFYNRLWEFIVRIVKSLES